jgi:hypothetical protein
MYLLCRGYHLEMTPRLREQLFLGSALLKEDEGYHHYNEL